MNTTNKTAVEEFTDKFFLVGHPVTGFQKADAKIALKAHQKDLLKAVVAEVRETESYKLFEADDMKLISIQDIEAIINKAIGV